MSPQGRRCRTSSESSSVVGGPDARQAEIENFQTSIGRDADVSRFQIAMDDALLVRECQSISELATKSNRVLRGQRTTNDVSGKRAALDVFHDEVVQAILAVKVMDRCDVGMICARECKRLTPKTTSRRPGQRLARRQHLDGDVPLQAFVPCEVDDPDPAGTNLLHDPVVSRG